MMRRRVRFAAVLVVVVLALTGFSTSSHGGKSGKSRSGKHSSSSGGGCSNDKKSNGGYHNSNYDDDYDSSSSSGNSAYGTPTPASTASNAPEVRVIRCAQPRKGKRKAVTASTVRLTAASSGTYDVDVTFLDARGNTVDTGETTVDVTSGDSQTLTVRMDSPGKVSKVKTCQVTAELSY